MPGLAGSCHMKKLVCICILCMVYSCAYSQQADSLRGKLDSIPLFRRYFIDMENDFSLLAGLHYNGYGFGELGVGVISYGRVGYHGLSEAAFVSSEFRPEKKFILGPKVGVYAAGGAGGMALGLNLVCYTDFSQAAWRIRPEIGFGGGPIRFSYGYNFALTNKSFPDVNEHIVTMAGMIRLKKLSEKKVENTWTSDQYREMMRPGPELKVLRVDTVITKMAYQIILAVNGWTHTDYEVGIGAFISESGKDGFMVFGYFSAEVMPEGHSIIGPKFGTYFSTNRDFAFCGGYEIIYYTDFDRNSWAIKPQAGIKYKTLRLAYGYNYGFSKYVFSRVNGHCVTVSCCINIKKYKDEVQLSKVYDYNVR